MKYWPDKKSIHKLTNFDEPFVAFIERIPESILPKFMKYKNGETDKYKCGEDNQWVLPVTCLRTGRHRSSFNTVIGAIFLRVEVMTLLFVSRRFIYM